MLKHFKTNYRTPANTKEATMQRITSLFKLVAILAVAAYMAHVLSAGQDNIINGGMGDIPAQEAPVDRAPVKASPSYQMEKHQDECWTADDAPKAELPGAAIVQFKDGTTKYVTNETPKGFKLVDAAFNEVLASVGFGDKTSDQIDVIALCI